MSETAMKAICHLSIVPVRREPSDRSEMVTQLLFGDLLEVTATDGNWAMIKILADGYPGWVDKRQLQPLTDQEFERIRNSSSRIIGQVTANVIEKGKKGFLHLVMGSQVHDFGDGIFKIADRTFEIAEGSFLPGAGTTESLIEFGYRYLHSPYLWGGKSPFGIDCSGFTQMVFRAAGRTLPRDAYQQAETGSPVSKLEHGKTGDLAFFMNADHKIVHVGILISNDSILHASGKVRVDSIDEQGIINADSGERTHQLHSIRRFF